MQPETIYKGHTIVPLCSGGPRYKAHYRITPPGGGASHVTYLTSEFATEVGALDAALEAAKKVVDKGSAAAGQVVALAESSAKDISPLLTPALASKLGPADGLGGQRGCHRLHRRCVQ